MRDFQALFAEAAARVMELERENDALAQEVADLKWRQGHIFEMDDGSYAYEFGCSGGAHDLGPFGEVILIFVDSIGQETQRTYTANDKIAGGNNESQA
jgi:hypothetical protein